MNSIIFGAELFKQLYQGRISKEAALEKIKNLTSSLRDEERAYLLKRVQDLVTR